MNYRQLGAIFGGVFVGGLFLDRLSALRESRHSKERLTIALAAGRAGTFEWDARTNQSHWSPEMYRLYGVPLTEPPLAYDDWLQAVLPEHREEADRAVKRALVTGDFRLNFPIRRPNDGEIRWLSSQAKVEFDKAGRPERVIGVNTDITDQKFAENQLRDAERRLQLAIEIADIAPWQYDISQNLLTVTPEWKRKFQLEGIEDTPAAWLARMHPEDQEAVLAYFNGCQQDPECQHRIEFRLHAGDGTEHWVACRAIGIRDSSNHLVRIFGTHLDITDRKAIERRIRVEALHDPLTGLPNRALLAEYGNHLLSAALRWHGTCALLFVDLDRFKPINDTYGHDAGDAVLVEVAKRLRKCTRQEDVVARLGGDEFAILLAHSDAGHRREEVVARHVIEAVEKPIPFGDQDLSVTPSIGMAYYPGQAEDINGLLQKADMAMYAARQGGYGNYQAYGTTLPTDDTAGEPRIHRVR